MKSSNISAAIVIVTWNSANEIADCLKPLQKLSENWEIFVSDNDSADETVNLVGKNFPRVKLLENKANLGFAEGCNKAIKISKSNVILLLNPDTIADAETLEAALKDFSERKETGAMGIKTVYEDGTLHQTCFPFPTLLKNSIDSLHLYRLTSSAWRENNLLSDYFDHQSEKKVDWLMGAAVFLKREAWEKIGGVPEDYFMFGEDMDLCLQIQKAGFEVVFNPAYTIIHKGDKSAGILPSDWRVERCTLTKYVFCFKNYGRLKTRLIQLTDLIGVNYSLLRAGNKKERASEIQNWKTRRKHILTALKNSRSEITKIVQTR